MGVKPTINLVVSIMYTFHLSPTLYRQSQGILSNETMEKDKNVGRQVLTLDCVQVWSRGFQVKKCYLHHLKHLALLLFQTGSYN